MIRPDKPLSSDQNNSKTCCGKSFQNGVEMFAQNNIGLMIPNIDTRKRSESSSGRLLTTSTTSRSKIRELVDNLPLVNNLPATTSIP